MAFGTMGGLVRATWVKWNRDDGWLYAAAMAAFAALALAPLLIITLRITEVFGQERALLRALALVIDPIVGHGAVRALNGSTGAGNGTHGGALAVTLSIVIALFAGSRLFYAVQRALHAMWNTPVRHSAGLGTTILSFLGAGALSVCVIGGMTCAIFGSAAFTFVAHSHGIQGIVASTGVRAGIAATGGLVLAPVVAALFKWLPGADLTWGQVWIGALTTTVGFMLAQLAIGVYLAFVNLPWTYGSAASVIVVLLWLYYSSYVFLLGAEFTQVYAQARGARARRRDGTTR